MEYVFTISCGIHAIISDHNAKHSRLGDSVNYMCYTIYQVGVKYDDHLLNKSLPFPDDVRIPQADMLNY